MCLPSMHVVGVERVKLKAALTVLREELNHGVTLVALELKDMSHVLVLDDGTIAAVLLQGEGKEE